MEHLMTSIHRSLAALAVLGLSATTYAGDTVPFFAFGSATGTIKPTDVAGVVEVDLGISLWATHLGKSTGPAKYLLDERDPRNLTFTGTFTAIGSNVKSSVTFSASGTLTPVDGSMCLFDFEQKFAVVSGTGAFANATMGGGTSTGQFSMCEGPLAVSVIDATFTGTIQRPNS
jgi:hypothetical protein